MKISKFHWEINVLTIGACNLDNLWTVKRSFNLRIFHTVLKNPSCFRTKTFFYGAHSEILEFSKHSLSWKFVSGFSRLEDLASLVETTVCPKSLVHFYIARYYKHREYFLDILYVRVTRKIYILLNPIFIASLPFDRWSVLARKFEKL